MLEVQSGGNGADAAGVLAFLGLVAYFYFVWWMISPMLSQINWIGEDGEASIVVPPTSVVPEEYLQPGYGGVSLYQTPTSVQSFVTSTLPPTQTPYPTYTPYPTVTPSVDWLRGSPTPTRNAFEPYQVNWVFSYYYPPLVSQREENPQYEVNCHVNNWIWNRENTRVVGCADVTASGLQWSQYIMYNAIDNYMGGVAVPYHPDTCPVISELCQPIYPMGSILRVTEPSQIAGDYLVIDICPGCSNYIQSHGVLFLDFLAEGLPPAVNFWDPVRIFEVIYP